MFAGGILVRNLKLFAALTLLAMLSISDASAASITAFLDYDISFGHRGTDLITGTVTLDTRRHTFTTDITVTGPVDPGTYSEIFEHFSANDFSRHDELRLGSLTGHHNVLLEAIPSANGFSSGETFVSFRFVDGDGRIRSDCISPVPLPSTWGMMLLGLFSLGFMAWRQKSRALRLAPT